MWTKKKLKKFLSTVKIQEDFIIIHSDIAGLAFSNFSVSELWKILFESFGKNKTYIFPSFTFSNHEKNTWSYKKTQSQVGVLSEYFRKKISIKRTIHPIHSVCFYGKKENEIQTRYCSSSFGKNSFWEWACNNKNVCNISLGLDLGGGATFCHYSEEFCKVKYRKFLNLNFKLIDKENITLNNKYIYYARKTKYHKKVLNDWPRIQKILEKKKLLKKYKSIVPRYQILKMNTYKVSQFLINELKKNQDFLLKDYL